MAYSQDHQDGWDKNSVKKTINNYETSSMASADVDIMPGETSPLLPQDDQSHAKIHLPKRRTVRSPHTIMVFMMLVVLFTSFGDQFIDPPETRIFESVICYRYYEKEDPSKIKLSREVIGPGAIGGVDEMWCKADAVQDELAAVNGYATFFDGFPALLLALPFGWAADRYGRWPFMVANLAQFAIRTMWKQFVTWNWQAFDIRTVWASTAFCVLGGGGPQASALLFVAVSDVLPSEERAGAFLRLGAVNLAGSVFIPPVAAWLMATTPWIPYLLGTLMQVLAALLCLLVPETLNYGKSAHRPATEMPDENPAEERPKPTVARRCWNSFKSSTSFLIHDWRVPALIAPFVVHILIANLTRLILQYSSKRYGLTIGQSTLLITLHNGIHVLLLFAILPYLSTLVTKKYHLSSQRKDLYLSRASHFFMALGWLCVAASPNVWTVAISLSIASLGVGGALLMRSFLTSLLPTHHIARAYAFVSIVDTLGAMFGTPMLAGLFKRGLALGGGWIGLPFYLIGLLCVFFTGLLFVVRLRKGEGERCDEEDEG